MSKGWMFAAVLVMLFFSPASRAVELTAMERVWLQAARPVLAFARQQALPLDIIVQPQPAPGVTPLGMAFVAGRCKLVLSMRGNPDAQAMLDDIGHGLLEPIVEAITAHELGHCWRHVQGHWGTLPQGFKSASAPHQATPEDAARVEEMRRARCEEGFADLVGLAWTLRHHPGRYAEVQAWHARVRADRPLKNGPHDTLVWVRLAADRSAFRPAASIFEQAEPLWRAGLRGEL